MFKIQRNRKTETNLCFPGNLPLQIDHSTEKSVRSMEVSRETCKLLKKHGITFDQSHPTHQDRYQNSNHEPKTNIIIEAKRLILNEQLDKILDLHLEDVCQKDFDDVKHCKRKDLNWDWNVPRPDPNYDPIKIFQINRVGPKTVLTEDSVFQRLEDLRKKNEKAQNEFVIKKNFFRKWREKVEEKRKRSIDCGEVLVIKKIQEEIEEESESLIDQFIENLKEKEKKAKVKKKVVKAKESEVFENRFEAQKSIILQQKTKLLEQEKALKELKFGKICNELDESIANTREELKQFYKNTSKPLKTKLGLPPKEPEQIEIEINRAPKLVREMERRAKERAAKRQAIKERKKRLDEEKRRLAQEAIENKRIQDEEEKQRSLEIIKERRRKELEVEKQRQMNKKNYLDGCRKADDFYRRKLLKKSLRVFKKLIEIRDANEIKSEAFYEGKLICKAFETWRGFVKEAFDRKVNKAEMFYRNNMLKKCFYIFQKNNKIAVQNYQVASDFYDLKLQTKYFFHYQMAVHKERMHIYQLNIKAKNHFKNRIMVQYFYLWRSLHAVLELEKAKEEKKKKWRQKVLEVLPDFKPPIYDD